MEKRGLADLRAMNRKKRLQKILALKRKPTPESTNEASALVIGVGPGICTVAVEGDSRQCRCDLPVAPGDLVSIRHEKVAAIAPRRSSLARIDPSNPHRERVVAANIDLLVIVAAIKDPPFRPGLVDRYLVAAARGGVQPVLCINKIDLGADMAIADLWKESGIPVVPCSTQTGAGIDALRGLMAGSLVVLAGHSGVGKSSLLNSLAGDPGAAVGNVNDHTGKGRHTTTSARLYQLRNGARIIDTPGIREFGLGPVSLTELRLAFPDFASFLCRFRDCTHRSEPGCGVCYAAESGEIANTRYTAWLRMTEDL
ncbi:MAG TPA: ribosome small subunit-dependent GTPase A [Bryobacteraceae bacterium]|nr:ribosome small subunit-dependent GTPase A [Bryobacteraceae bacterium]